MNTKHELAQARKHIANVEQALRSTEFALYLTEQAWLKANEEWVAHAISDDAFRNLENYKAEHPQIKMRDMRAAFIGDSDAKPH
jgi:hypothetical protein